MIEMSEVAVSRFSATTGYDLAIDWCSVIAMQKMALCINIHLKTGTILTVQAPTSEINDTHYETLYVHWEQSIKRYM